MLEISGLAKSYDGRVVLAGVDLRVEPGESVALLGGNGSGKTTTLRAIVGLMSPDRGSVRIEGIDTHARPRESRRHLSYLPQKALFPATLSVHEVLRVAARLRRASDMRVEEELERCALLDRAERHVATLSGGERQRLGLAVAFLPDVPLFLFDEPTANLDAHALEIFFCRARALVNEGRSVLFTTHVSADVETLATRTALLRDGIIASTNVEAPLPQACASVPRKGARSTVGANRELFAPGATA